MSTYQALHAEGSQNEERSIPGVPANELGNHQSTNHCPDPAPTKSQSDGEGAPTSEPMTNRCDGGKVNKPETDSCGRENFKV